MIAEKRARVKDFRFNKNNTWLNIWLGSDNNTGFIIHSKFYVWNKVRWYSSRIIHGLRECLYKRSADRRSYVRKLMSKRYISAFKTEARVCLKSSVEWSVSQLRKKSRRFQLRVRNRFISGRRKKNEKVLFND